MSKESVKRFIKKHIPWKVRYFIKLQEAKGNIKLSHGIKQQRSIKEYNDAFYNALKILKINDFNGKTVCELGPGQHLIHPFLEYQMGAEEELLLEIVDFANVDSSANTNGLELVQGFKKVRSLPELSKGVSWREYLRKINATYKINGLKGYKEVADESIDYVFSFAVFEHIRKREFEETIKEIYRFMRHGGLSYHTVDYTDHMGGGKNQLRFPENVWEDSDHYNMDNYTNRISCSEMCKMMKDIGFSIVEIRRKNFTKIPIKRAKIDNSFSCISDDDLGTAQALIIAKKI